MPFSAVLEIVSLGSDCIRVKGSQIGTIPVTTIGGKTRLLKPTVMTNIHFEISCSVHSSQMPEILGIMHAAEKDTSHENVNSLMAKRNVPFDLTSLSSHRESLLLSHPLCVVRVKKMIEISGLLQISRQYMYFQPMASFGSRKVKKFALKNALGGSVTTNQMSYKLRDTCVEFMFPSGKNLLIQFVSKPDRDLLLSSLGPGCSPLLTVASLDMSSSLPAVDIVKELWRTSAISNFDYLMYLNFCSGRSVNDIGQYPILPWTVSELSSPAFDLQRAEMYRDLSVPVAATNTARLEQCRARAEHMPINERFLFGSFYSNPAFVLYFLIRKFPECHLRLHGGHFDHTARLFTSVKAAWQAVAESGSATMELIPEFYSEWDSASSWLENLPALTHVPPVTLPPWASSSRDFVIKMRCALESRHVSENLHHWIDLVFGVKSRGRNICFDNHNLFHPICYLQDAEGDVVRYCREHDVKKEIVLLQSQEFGHVPRQLFVAEPHPPRDLNLWRPERSEENFYESGTGGKESWRNEVLNAFSKIPKAVPLEIKLEDDNTASANAIALGKGCGVAVDKRSWTFGGHKVTDFALNKSSGDSVAVTADGFLVSTLNDTKWRVSVNRLNSITPSPIGESFYLCTDSRTGHIHSVSPTEGLVFSKQVHSGGGVNCCIILNDSLLGVSGGHDQTCCVFRISDFELLHVLDAHSAPVVALAPLGNSRFVSADSKGMLASWDLEKSHSDPLILVPVTNNISVTCLHAANGRAVVTDISGAMILVDIETSFIVWRHCESNVRFAYFPILHDNYTIFGVCDTNVKAFRLGTANGVSQLTISGQANLSSPVKIDASTNRSLVLTSDNSLQVLSVKNK